MSNAMKSTGKTVDEAVREALLRMGLRRDEVSVTVIQEARGGLLGFGRRDAVVEVAKKSEFDRDGRRRGSTRRSDGRRGSEGGDEGRQDARGARGGERRGGRRDERDGADTKGGDRSRRGGRGRSRGRGRDEETKDQPVVAEAQEPRAPRQEARQDASPQDTRSDDRRNEDGKDDSRRRRRRPRRRRKSSDQDEGNVQQQAEAAAFQTGVQAAPEQVPSEVPEVRDEVVEAVNDTAAEAAAFQTGVQAAPEQTEATPDQEPVQERQERPEPEQAPSGLARAADLTAAELVTPFGADHAVDEVELLTRVATSLMVKAGFQSRVTVTPGDYHQVKMVVDDRSAGVLIGRQGSTVDAVEHLIDRIATRVAGERVKFNLDINNYRLRREDGLLGSTRRAMDDARQSGEPVFMEPAGGRERRLVHLEVAEADDLVTYTEDGEHGKFVVICRPEQVPTEHRDVEVHGPAPAAAAAEAPGEPRADA